MTIRRFFLLALLACFWRDVARGQEPRLEHPSGSSQRQFETGTMPQPITGTITTAQVWEHDKTEIAERRATVDGKKYAVTYQWQPYGIASVPATMPAGKVHYKARIAVFEIEGKTRTQVGPTVDGEYVPDGPCTEDDPATLVKAAVATPTDLTVYDTTAHTMAMCEVGKIYQWSMADKKWKCALPNPLTYQWDSDKREIVLKLGSDEIRATPKQVFEALRRMLAPTSANWMRGYAGENLKVPVFPEWVRPDCPTGHRCIAFPKAATWITELEDLGLDRCDRGMLFTDHAGTPLNPNSLACDIKTGVVTVTWFKPITGIMAIGPIVEIYRDSNRATLVEKK